MKPSNQESRRMQRFVDSVDSWKNQLYRGTKKNAATRGLPWDLTIDEFKQLIVNSKMKCSVTGIALVLERSEIRGRRPFYPSLDRIDSSRGYSFDNCRIVCVAANLAMNQWGEDVLRKIAIGFFQHQDLGRSIRRGELEEVLPDNVVARRGVKGITYMARIRNVNGKDISLGTYKTAAEAAAAQENWANENRPTNLELSLTLAKTA